MACTGHDTPNVASRLYAAPEQPESGTSPVVGTHRNRLLWFMLIVVTALLVGDVTGQVTAVLGGVPLTVAGTAASGFVTTLGIGMAVYHFFVPKEK